MALEVIGQDNSTYAFFKYILGGDNISKEDLDYLNSIKDRLDKYDEYAE